MANEKKLIVTNFNVLAAEAQAEWESNGWSVEHEISPIVKEFVNTPFMGDVKIDHFAPDVAVSPDSFNKVHNILTGTDHTT